MSSEKDILIITPSKLRGVRVGESVIQRVELDWTPEKLSQALATVRAALSKRIRLVLGDSFTYISSVPLAETSSSEEERNAAGESFQLLIPEKLSETSWDYCAFEIPATKETSTRPRRYAEIIALTGSFARTVIPAIKEAGFRIETLEPESVSFARLLQTEDTCSMLVAKSESSFLIAGIIRGHVLASFSSIAELSDTVILEAKRFLEYRFSCSIQHLHVVGAFAPDDFVRVRPEVLDQHQLTVSIHEGSAAEGIAMKDIAESANDAATLSLDLSTLEHSAEENKTETTEDMLTSAFTNNVNDTNQDNSSTPSERFRLHFLTERSAKSASNKENSSWSPERKRTIILASIFLIVLLLGGSAIFAMLRSRSESSAPQSENRSPEINQGTAASPEDTVNQEETTQNDTTNDVENVPDNNTPASLGEESSWNRQSFRIAIENGSGVAGAAAALKDTLSAKDFVVVSVGNADSLSSPTIIAKPDIPDAFLDELKNTLPAENWTIDRKDSLSLSDTDIVITLGIKQ